MGRPIHPETIRKTDALAELMAEGCPSVADAARTMGEDRKQMDRLWQRIRTSLGRQAQ